MTIGTYVGVIEELKILIELNQSFASGLQSTVSDLRYSKKDRDTAQALAQFSQIQVDKLKVLASSVATLGMTNSSEPYDKIIEALGK